MLSVVVAAWGGWLSFQALKARDDVEAEDAECANSDIRKCLRSCAREWHKYADDLGLFLSAFELWRLPMMFSVSPVQRARGAARVSARLSR